MSRDRCISGDGLLGCTFASRDRRTSGDGLCHVIDAFLEMDFWDARDVFLDTSSSRDAIGRFFGCT